MIKIKSTVSEIIVNGRFVDTPHNILVNPSAFEGGLHIGINARYKTQDAHDGYPEQAEKRDKENNAIEPYKPAVPPRKAQYSVGESYHVTLEKEYFEKEGVSYGSFMKDVYKNSCDYVVAHLEAENTKRKVNIECTITDL